MAVVLALCIAGAARAQSVDVQTFTPAAGRSVAITIPEPALPAHGTLRLAVAANYARRPWTREVDCGQRLAAPDPLCQVGVPDRSQFVLVPHMAQADVSVALALFEALQLGAVLPAVYARTVDDREQPRAYQTSVGLGDLRLSVDAPIVSGATAVGLSLVVSLPTGRASTSASQADWSLRPAIVGRQRFGPLHVGLSLGYRTRQRVQVAGLDFDDELDLAAGASYALPSSFDARLELRARIGVAGELSASRDAAEVDAALGHRLGSQLQLLLGGGLGTWPGLRGYGSPNFRVFGSVAYELDARGCRFGAEDRDGYQDNDSCRDPDNDRDGTHEPGDQCPDDAEDRDGFADADGCPELDNDADGLLDAVDRCARRSEDRDGFEDEDGCPEPDNDADGKLDALDGCPLDPEDTDGYEDEDGCPEPGPSAPSVSVVERRILVSDRIYFDDARDTIREVSRPVLDQVAAVIRGLRAGLKVIVEGHSDDEGSAANNLDLSHRRARAVVEYLHARGVSPDRLDYVGHGSTRPLGPNDSPEGRALNRRVEFTITE